MAGAFAGIGLVGLLDVHLRSLSARLGPTAVPFFVSSFGTLSVVLYAAPDSKIVSLWNIIVGHLIGAACAVAAVAVFGPGVLARAAGLSAAIGLMIVTDALHPPGGAMVLLFNDSAAFQSLPGPLWLVYPGLAGALVLYGVNTAMQRLRRSLARTDS